MCLTVFEENDMAPLPTKATTSSDELMKFYLDMQTIRRMEVVLDTEYKVKLNARSLYHFHVLINSNNKNNYHYLPTIHQSFANACAEQDDPRLLPLVRRPGGRVCGRRGRRYQRLRLDCVLPLPWHCVRGTLKAP